MAHLEFNGLVAQFRASEQLLKARGRLDAANLRYVWALSNVSKSAARADTARKQAQAASMWHTGALASSIGEDDAAANLRNTAAELLAALEEVKDSDLEAAKSLKLLEAEVAELGKQFDNIKKQNRDMKIYPDSAIPWLLDTFARELQKHGVSSFSIIEAAAPSKSTAAAILSEMTYAQQCSEFAACALSKNPRVDDEFMKWFADHCAFTCSGFPPITDGWCQAFVNACRSEKYDLAQWMFINFGLHTCDPAWLRSMSEWGRFVPDLAEYLLAKK